MLRYLPNALTLLRIVLVLPMAYLLKQEIYVFAFYLFCIAGLTDAIDGFLARLLHCDSRFGSIADPLADKCLLITSFVGLAWHGHLPWWLVVTIICRDCWIVGGALIYHIKFGRYGVKPHWLSKINTFVQIVLIGAVLFSLGLRSLPVSWLDVLILLTTIFCLLSWVEYTWVWGVAAWRQARQKRILI